MSKRFRPVTPETVAKIFGRPLSTVLKHWADVPVRKFRSQGSTRPAPLIPPPRNFADLPDIITPGELAAWLRVPESWVYEKTRKRCRNPIPCEPIGRYVRFHKVEVARWLEERRSAGSKK